MKKVLMYQDVFRFISQSGYFTETDNLTETDAADYEMNCGSTRGADVYFTITETTE